MVMAARIDPLACAKKEPHQPKEAFMVSKMAGLDAGSGHIIGGLPGRDVEHHLVTTLPRGPPGTKYATEICERLPEAATHFETA